MSEELKNKNGEGLAEDQLTIIDPDGKETLCQILFTMESKEFGHNYVVFYPIDEYDKTPDDGELEIMGARYVVKEDGTGELSDLETDEEFAMLDAAVKQFQEDEEKDEDESEDDSNDDSCPCDGNCDCENGCQKNDNEENCCCENKGKKSCKKN
jgi:uncharacterized protein YrzB (UPF0473 family)